MANEFNLSRTRQPLDLGQAYLESALLITNIIRPKLGDFSTM